jgi:hypothetical protein
VGTAIANGRTTEDEDTEAVAIANEGSATGRLQMTNGQLKTKIADATDEIVPLKTVKAAVITDATASESEGTANEIAIARAKGLKLK